ncbi:hydroxymethylglutaryl-CoA synthase family protein [Amycolatopsis acidicola]|uniref:Hydroxymethylglutaryl-CoA synthase family protein n=1 Tax=Amycolatopsis acidicola TaxID=2596893 RepID=A0A5N0VIJ3_9PSEU|nr:OB-fold domain-containing protein [Amycolatopsis acidicola]KAA9166005.1 hydroxymethylglutaryl-CoA synthase family protein [Amycolatopsis acidicola]
MSTLLAYSAYLPKHRLRLSEKDNRVAASFDEDSTTMAVEAASALLRDHDAAPEVLYFATTSPAYFDKTNASAIHAALGLPQAVFAADLAGSARSGFAAWRAARAAGGLAVVADVRTGRPGSGDERGGGDGAVAFLFGDEPEGIAEVLAEHSLSAELLDRWRQPGDAAGGQWEERFGLETYLPLLRQTAVEALKLAGLGEADHVVVVSPNSGVRKQAARVFPGATSSPIGHSGAADFALGLADVLDRAGVGETVLILSAADGCDAIVLRTTERLPAARQARSVAGQLADGVEVPYLTYLNWRGWLEREPPRRPEPDLPAAPPSSRTAAWKFSFTGSACGSCGFVHLPPQRGCKKCGSVDEMEPRRLASAQGTVATYTVDRLAFSPSPPLIEAVVDFDGGGRYTLEVADALPEELAVGTRVGLSFRRLFTAGGVHNYFWKARL